jgi:hypothetical protein
MIVTSKMLEEELCLVEELATKIKVGDIIEVHGKLCEVLGIDPRAHTGMHDSYMKFVIMEGGVRSATFFWPDSNVRIQRL